MLQGRQNHEEGGVISLYLFPVSTIKIKPKASITYFSTEGIAGI